jgi:hypothetical protein
MRRGAAQVGRRGVGGFGRAASGTQRQNVYCTVGYPVHCWHMFVGAFAIAGAAVFQALEYYCKK